MQGRNRVHESVAGVAALGSFFPMWPPQRNDRRERSHQKEKQNPTDSSYNWLWLPLLWLPHDLLLVLFWWCQQLSEGCQEVEAGSGHSLSVAINPARIMPQRIAIDPVDRPTRCPFSIIWRQLREFSFTFLCGSRDAGLQVSWYPHTLDTPPYSLFLWRLSVWLWMIGCLLEFSGQPLFKKSSQTSTSCQGIYNLFL